MSLRLFDLQLRKSFIEQLHIIIVILEVGIVILHQFFKTKVGPNHLLLVCFVSSQRVFVILVEQIQVCHIDRHVQVFWVYLESSFEKSQ